MKTFVTALVLISASFSVSAAGEPLPIDPLWKSAAFRKAFTASYGVDARIEPRLSTDEKPVLDAVAGEMADGDRDGAIAKLTGSSLLGGSPALIFNLGNLRFEEGKLEDAIENFTKAVELYPNFRDAHRNLAVALVQDGDFEKAEPHLRRAIELGAADGVTFGLLAYCHASGGRHQPSLQAYRMAQLTMPDELQWQIGEAQALTALGDLGAAESLFGGILEKRPADPGLWLRQADVWISSTEPEKAIANLEFADRLQPLASTELASLGDLYLDQNLPGEALRCYANAIERRGEGGTDRILDGLDYLCAYRHFDEATKLVAAIDEAGVIGEESPELPRLERVKALIDLESGTGDVAAGVARVEKLIEKNPLDGEALMILARHKQRSDRRDEAMLLLEQAAKVDATRAEALWRHGRMLVEDRNYSGGLELIEDSLALQSRPSVNEYVDAVRRFAEREE